MIYIMYTQKDLIMMYNTCLRNVGLFTSLSFGLLTISRFYRKNDDDVYNLFYIFFSIIFISLSVVIAKFLLKDIKLFIKNDLEKEDKKIMEKWLIVPKVVYYTNSIICIFTIYTFIRQILANKNSWSH